MKRQKGWFRGKFAVLVRDVIKITAAWGVINLNNGDFFEQWTSLAWMERAQINAGVEHDKSSRPVFCGEIDITLALNTWQ